MIATLHLGLVAVQAASFAAQSDDEGPGFAFLFLTLGFVFYGVQWARYRNADKRHRHETETKALKVNEEKKDQFVRSQKGLRESTMKGANHRRIGGAVKDMGRWFSG